MSDESNDFFKARVVADSKWMDWLIFSSAAIALVTIADKALGGTSFKVGDVEIPTSYAWVVFVGLTAVHLYLAWLIISSSHTLWKQSATAVDAFRQITAEGGLLLRGLVPRITYRKGKDGKYLFKMPSTDLTIWPSYALMILVVAAVIPFSLRPFGTFYIIAIVALFLEYVNWRIAANWLVALSDLNLPPAQSVYHARIEAVGANFVFQHTDSGPDLNPFIVWFVIAVDALALMGLFALSVMRHHPAVAVPSRTLFYVLLLLSVSYLDFGKIGTSSLMRWLLVRLPLLILPSAYLAWRVGGWG